MVGNRPYKETSASRYMRRHMEQGLCRSCAEPVVLGRSLCAVHLLKNRTKVEQWRKVWPLVGKCARCGAPKHDDADAGFGSCINCRNLGSMSTTFGMERQD